MRAKDAPLERIEGYWNRVRAGRIVPRRSEIDPRGLEGVLGHAFILERIAGGLARFRIAGSHMGELVGTEMRGLPISAVFGAGSREALSDALHAVFDDPAVVRFSLASSKGFGRAALEGELILLPLRSDLGDVSRVLGGVVLRGAAGRTPRRFDITDQTRKGLTGYGEPPLSGSIRRTRPKLAHRISTDQTRLGHLRLVVVNEI